MKQLNYNPNLAGLTIVKNTSDQWHLVFQEGHPKFLIPDFNTKPLDIWLTYMDYIEKEYGSIYDQDGGEIINTKIIDTQSGLTSVEYQLYGISLESDMDNLKDWTIEIEGYVIQQDVNNGYFLATKITGDL